MYIINTRYSFVISLVLMSPPPFLTLPPLSPPCWITISPLPLPELGICWHNEVLLPKAQCRWTESGHQVHPHLQHGHHGYSHWSTDTEVSSWPTDAYQSFLLCSLRSSFRWRQVLLLFRVFFFPFYPLYFSLSLPWVTLSLLLSPFPLLLFATSSLF